MPLIGNSPRLTAAEADRADRSVALLQLINGHWAAQTVRAMASLRIAEHVSAGARTAKAVSVLESSDEDATFRLMRAAAALGLLTCNAKGEFAVTALGDLLREGVSGSLRAAALARSGPGVWDGLGLLPQAVRAGTSRLEETTGGDIFDYFAVNGEAGQTFARAMSDLSAQVAEDAVALLSPGEASRVVDVGGSNGALVLALLRAHPDMSGQVLDLPHVMEGAMAAAMEAGLQDRFSAVAGDFFESVPPADYYLLKWVLHDWPDHECVQILGNCRKAGGRGARMLVIESLISEVGSPDPVALFDMNMLAVTGGKQRSLAEFDELFAASGWRRAAVSSTRTTDSLLDLEAV
jgi:hypothetical protein